MDKSTATRNLINKKENKCFQYAVTFALDHEEIGKDPERITKIKPLIDKYEWKGINLTIALDVFLIDKYEWKRINLTIAVDVSYAKKENIYPAYVSKHIVGSLRRPSWGVLSTLCCQGILDQKTLLNNVV